MPAINNNSLKKILIALGILVLIIIPQLPVSSYYINLLSLILIFALLAMGLNLLVGYTGLSSLGHAAFFGSTAYCAGILSSHYGWSFLASSAAGVIFIILLAGGFGLINVRSKGVTFLMVSIAFGQIIWGLSQSWSAVTGGANGLVGISDPSIFGYVFASCTSYYYIILFVLICCSYLLYRIINSSFGLTLQGIKDNSKRMTSLGYNVFLHSWIAYIISGTLSGIAGILYAYYNNFVSPTDVSVITSAKVMMMVLVGGAGTFFGPALGAIIIVSLENLLSAFTNRWVLIMGIIYILVVMFTPAGLVELIKNSYGKVFSKGDDSNSNKGGDSRERGRSTVKS